MFQSITVNFGRTTPGRGSTQLDVSGSAVIVIHEYFFSIFGDACRCDFIQMAPTLTREQKTRTVEWFLCTDSTDTAQRRFKNQYKRKEAPARNTLKTLIEQFCATGNVTSKKRGGSKPRVRTPDAVGTIRASVASSPTRKSVWQSQKMRYLLRQHGAYFERIYACIRTRSMSSSLWQLCAEKSGQVLRRNSVITCSRNLWDYLKDKVFSSASRTLSELKERIKESCAQVTRGIISGVAQNFVLRLQWVRESQGTHIEHVIHKAIHMWN